GKPAAKPEAAAAKSDAPGRSVAKTSSVAAKTAAAEATAPAKTVAKTAAKAEPTAPKAAPAAPIAAKSEAATVSAKLAPVAVTSPPADASELKTLPIANGANKRGPEAAPPQITERTAAPAKPSPAAVEQAAQSVEKTALPKAVPMVKEISAAAGV